MRHIPLLLVLSVVIAAIAVGQTGSRDAAPAADRAASPRSYVVRIVEFRMPSASNPAISTDEIVRSFGRMHEEGTLDLVQTLRMSGVENEENMGRFGSTVPVTGEVTVGSGGATTRSVHWEDVGTIVRLTATPQDGMTLLRISYEAVRFDGERDEFGSSQSRVSIETTLLLEPGVPTLVAGTSEGDSCYLMVMLEE